MGVGLAQQVLELVDLVAGVDRDQHRADLDRGPEGEVPLRHVGGPNGHLVAGLDAHGDERARELVHVGAELRVGAHVVLAHDVGVGIVPAVRLGEAEGVLARVQLADAVEQLREGLVDEVLLGPGIGAVVGERVLQLELDRRRHGRTVRLVDHGLGCGGLHAGLVVEHVAQELREDDARLAHGDVARPLGDPLEAHIAVVARVAQRVEHGVQGQVAVAHHAVLKVVAHLHGVLHLAVAQVAPQVGDARGGVLAKHAVGVVEVPQRPHALHAHPVEHAGQTGRVGVLGDGLNQKRHVVDAGIATKLGQHVHDVVVVNLARRMDVLGHQHAHVGGAHVARELDVVHDLGDVLLAATGVGQLAVGREARDLEAHALELHARALAAVGQEGRGAGRVGAALDAADLDAVEAEVLGDGIDVSPRVRGAAEGRKGELHVGSSLWLVSRETR